MGREVRRVPADWQHPTGDDGRPKPLLEPDRDPLELVEQWLENAWAWRRGEHPDYDPEYGTFSAWDGGPPDPDDYMPYWPESERTHWQMYECTTEGTPISPVCESPEELARWLADNDASAFADQTATYEQWLAIIVGAGSAPSMVVQGGTISSGVDRCTERATADRNPRSHAVTALPERESPARARI